MAELLINPNDFQEQIDTFSSATDTVGALKYTAEPDGVLLQCIDQYGQCLTAMNELISKFAEFAKMDAQTMQQIKATWMHADGDIATKTFTEWLGGWITGSDQ